MDGEAVKLPRHPKKSAIKAQQAKSEKKSHKEAQE
jgi:hypothetical protein